MAIFDMAEEIYLVSTAEKTISVSHKLLLAFAKS